MKEKAISAKVYIKNYLPALQLETFINCLEYISDREKQISIRYLLKMEHQALIAEDFGLSGERVRQIAEKAKRRIGKRIAEYPARLTEIEQKEQQIRLLKYQVEKLKQQLAERQIKEMPSLEIDAIALEDLNTSVRLYNSLKSAKINNIGQIRELTFVEFTRMRNVGKASVTELRELMQHC
jgi:hypothetical protein